jgi:hypothetical protein
MRRFLLLLIVLSVVATGAQAQRFGGFARPPFGSRTAFARSPSAATRARIMAPSTAARFHRGVVVGFNPFFNPPVRNFVFFNGRFFFGPGFFPFHPFFLRFGFPFSPVFAAEFGTTRFFGGSSGPLWGGVSGSGYPVYINAPPVVVTAQPGPVVVYEPQPAAQASAAASPTAAPCTVLTLP